MNEGGSYSLICATDGYPKPNVTWIKVDSGQRFDGNTLNFTNINRNDGGQYRCEAVNDCGSDSRLQQIEVFCKYIIRRTDGLEGCLQGTCDLASLITYTLKLSVCPRYNQAGPGRTRQDQAGGDNTQITDLAQTWQKD